MSRLLVRLLINAVALYVAIALVQGIRLEGGFVQLLIVALVFGLVNALIRPVVSILSCPLTIITLGLFTLVINAVMLWLTSVFSRALGLGFIVEGPVAALVGAIIISIVSFVLSIFLRDER
ncbi:MAG: phage holin family protein [Ardenticatenaceae bacterium]|nr:phage holin family protein [Ardenticatenaceae bacterium]